MAASRRGRRSRSGLATGQRRRSGVPRAWASRHGCHCAGILAPGVASSCCPRARSGTVPPPARRGRRHPPPQRLYPIAMANVIIVGMQWGDEGKGKIVDLICPAFDVVARFQGGHNAGHTVKFGDSHFSLHLIPSGILHPGMQLRARQRHGDRPRGLLRARWSTCARPASTVEGRLFVSSRAPAHPSQPRRPRRRARGGAGARRKIGTTARGIGPAYESKVGRATACAWRPLRPPTSRSGCARCCCASKPSSPASAASPSVGAGARSPSAAATGAQRLAPYRRRHRRPARRLAPSSRAGGCSSRAPREHCSTSTTAPTPTSPAPTPPPAAPPPAAACRRPPSTARIGVLKAYTTRVGGGPFTTEDPRRRGRVPAPARQRVRHHHRPPPPLRLARPRRRPLRRGPQRRRRPGADQARRARRLRRDPGLRRLPLPRRAVRRLPRRPRSARGGQAESTARVKGWRKLDRRHPRRRRPAAGRPRLRRLDRGRARGRPSASSPPAPAAKRPCCATTPSCTTCWATASPRWAAEPRTAGGRSGAGGSGGAGEVTSKARRPHTSRQSPPAGLPNGGRSAAPRAGFAECPLHRLHGFVT